MSLTSILLYVCLWTYMCTCASEVRGQVAHHQVSPAMWVLGTKFRSQGLGGKHLSLLSHFLLPLWKIFYW